jgi:hypothetical protein
MTDDDERLYRVLRRLTFFVVGQSLDYEIVQPIGSGFFIAPYTAITAGHVVTAMWDELQMPWRRSKYQSPAGQVSLPYSVTRLTATSRT